jgi:hypothetical protein
MTNASQQMAGDVNLGDIVCVAQADRSTARSGAGVSTRLLVFHPEFVDFFQQSIPILSARGLQEQKASKLLLGQFRRPPAALKQFNRVTLLGNLALSAGNLLLGMRQASLNGGAMHASP